MPNLLYHQLAIYKAHFNNQTAEASKLIVPSDLSAIERLNIYRNNTFITLTDALESTFPVVQKLVGDDFFNYMASEYIKTSPPIPGPLSEYGDNFSCFIEDFKPASSLSYLSDIARLEWLLNVSYYSKDLPPLYIKDLSSFTELQLPKLKFHFHPSCKTLRSNHPIDQIWKMNQEGSTAHQIDIDKPSNVLIVRPFDTVTMHSLDQISMNFVKLLAQGKSLEEAYLNVENISSDFDPAKLLVDLFSFNAIAKIDTSPLQDFKLLNIKGKNHESR